MPPLPSASVPQKRQPLLIRSCKKEAIPSSVHATLGAQEAPLQSSSVQTHIKASGLWVRASIAFLWQDLAYPSHYDMNEADPCIVEGLVAIPHNIASP